MAVTIGTFINHKRYISHWLALNTHVCRIYSYLHFTFQLIILSRFLIASKINFWFVKIDDHDWVAYDCYIERAVLRELKYPCMRQSRHAHWVCADAHCARGERLLQEKWCRASDRIEITSNNDHKEQTLATKVDPVKSALHFWNSNAMNRRLEPRHQSQKFNVNATLHHRCKNFTRYTITSEHSKLDFL